MPPEPNATTENKDDVQALKKELDMLREEKKTWSSGQEGLNEKVQRERQDQEKKASDSKNLESALTFNLTSGTFLKANESVLPKEIGDIFKAAEKESYSSAIEKANATKSAIVQAFFSQQANVDYLTDNQKTTLADFLKLTKNGKEEKAQAIYDNLFEPALSTLKRVKKAEDLAKQNQGFGGNTDVDQAYKARLTEMANKKYFGGKK